MLLVRFRGGDRKWWATPGGGVEPGESDVRALARELVEEVGLSGVAIGPCIWTREHWFRGLTDHGGQTERIFLVRTAVFEPAPALGAELLRGEGVNAVRWWAPTELVRSRESFAPHRLQTLVGDLLEHGPPPAPLDAGV